ncbi:MAG: methylated-DNA--[protein]-cysteine S-methyltransferase [Candidatus Limnocylindrales bacterium]
MAGDPGLGSPRARGCPADQAWPGHELRPARAVGAAMGRNPFWIFVPCHRVVAGDGTIGGYGGGDDALEIKRDLLALEGTVPPISGLLD